MKNLLKIITFTTVLAFNSAWAIDLGDAKNQGLVGETPSGYLEAVKGPNDDVKNLIKSINSKRKKQYQKIASENNTSLDAVESMAGEKAMNMTEKGNFIKLNGKWIKK